MTDNELLEQLFRPVREMQLEDNGFSQQVMQRLPHQGDDVQWLSHVWTAFCVLVAVVLFVLLDGWGLIVRGLFTLMSTPPSQHHLLMIAVTLAVLLLVAVSEVMHRERFSTL